MTVAIRNITRTRSSKSRAGIRPMALRDLCRMAERENAAMGLLLALDPPTKGMLSEAASAGRFQLPGLTKTNPIVGEALVASRCVGSDGNEREGTSPSPTGKRPDLSVPIGNPRSPLGGLRQKAKRRTKPQNKPELGI